MNECKSCDDDCIEHYKKATTSLSASLVNGTIRPVQQLISSSAGAILTSLCVTPLDVIKVRMQAQNQPLKKGSCFVCSSRLGFDTIAVCTINGQPQPHDCHRLPWYARPVKFNGTSDAFIKIVRQEGVTSLWSGLTPTLLMAVPSTVVYFTLYDTLLVLFRKELCEKSTSRCLNVLAPVVAGTLARTAMVSVVSPLELFRTKMQSEQMAYRDLFYDIRHSIARVGLRSLWLGWAPTMLRDVPFSALYWACYEYVKSKLVERHNRTAQYNLQRPTFAISFAAGAISGSFAALITLPFDVIKTRRQIQIGQDFFAHKTSKYSTFGLMSEMYRQQGFRSLFAGALPRIARVAPSCAIMIGTYEYGKNFFMKYNQSH